MAWLRRVGAGSEPWQSDCRTLIPLHLACRFQPSRESPDVEGKEVPLPWGERAQVTSRTYPHLPPWLLLFPEDPRSLSDSWAWAIITCPTGADLSWSYALSWGLIASHFSKQRGDSSGSRTMFSLFLYVVSLGPSRIRAV